ncbi:hypothetical protein SERLA73DRAFT_68346 [Serpula lacrymans var. lacrymans S7.3]|uniref:Uncharacterized protein n=2 Tax=Serpula lacrymans var. lacrymans TaxID=341189 RepID=F8PEZ5_SERL3|nr:uncharacterized protein SERLADRAFT_432094 [Serpula lacrymans var. lacrymans S7.9]EGO04668.1 hypothetical protein SERLA73DRAFT_68346 [Serpula lacrymans var. lacrymans S7.3]EGO30523.1 hypothetical protein SERLADRAFT_432094 [Serpula lacrymans var. lacrymans S7.9]
MPAVLPIPLDHVYQRHLKPHPINPPAIQPHPLHQLIIHPNPIIDKAPNHHQIPPKPQNDLLEAFKPTIEPRKSPRCAELKPQGFYRALHEGQSVASAALIPPDESGNENSDNRAYTSACLLAADLDAQLNSNTPTMAEAPQGPHRDKWLEAINEEFRQ